MLSPPPQLYRDNFSLGTASMELGLFTLSLSTHPSENSWRFPSPLPFIWLTRILTEFRQSWSSEFSLRLQGRSCVCQSRRRSSHRPRLSCRSNFQVPAPTYTPPSMLLVNRAGGTTAYLESIHHLFQTES